MKNSRLFEALLRMYPRAFRDAFAGDMRAAFADALAARRGVVARTVFLLRAVPDLLRSAGAEWVDVIRELPSPRPMLADLPITGRRAARALVRVPPFTVAAVLTLAIGIGATTAVFSVMSAALLEPLPYPNAKRLMVVEGSTKGEGISLSYPDLMDLRTRSHLTEGFGGFYGQSFTLTGGADAVRIPGDVVTANLFGVLGVQPILGHTFAESDDALNAPRVVAISSTLWRDQFGADSGIVGKAITLDGAPFTVVAVMPDGFHFPDGVVYGPSNLWTPMSQLDAGDRPTRDAHAGIVGVALRRRGVSYDDAERELHGIAAQLAAEYPATNRDGGVFVHDPVDAIVGDTRDAIRMLFGAALLVLLVACANVGALLLTRTEARRREMAIRVALGASGVRVAADLVAEAILLAVAGGTCGTLLAFTMVRAFRASLSALPRLATVTVDSRALMFALAASAAVAAACVLLPFWSARRADVQRWLRTRGAAGAMTVRVRHTLVVLQVGMSLVLVVSSTLLVRTFGRAANESGGIRAENVTTFAIQLPDSRYGQPAARAQLVSAMTDKLSAVTGVSHAGAIGVLPFSGSGAQSGITRFGESREQAKRTDVNAVTPDYFAAMGVDVLAGRAFTSADADNAQPVAVVDEVFAKAMWPNEDPLGKRVSGWGKPEWTIVGVVRHVKNYGVTADSRQEMYVPYAQRPTFRAYLIVRSASPAGVVDAGRAAAKSLDPSLAVFAARSMRTVVNATLANARLAALLSAAYAIIALVVAVIGIHGAIAYLVQRRTREIGVRLALGAQSRQVLRLVMSQGLRLTATGVAAGLIGAYVAGRLLRKQLYGVAANDAATFVIAAGAMIVVAAVASGLPARRAARVSPLVSLSDD
ncbi:MAG TPA: ABC transporter permease [Gemmatimonadaceae bacterium]|nr:ABC transporter permease [Gemmatimonadaceae bacterium]